MHDHRNSSSKSSAASASPADLTSGITPTTAHSVAVTFNVIVPLHHWLWDDKTNIYLRFGDGKLGAWKQDVGVFEIKE